MEGSRPCTAPIIFRRMSGASVGASPASLPLLRNSLIDVVDFLVSSNASTCHQFTRDVIIYDVLRSIFLNFIIPNDEPIIIIFNRLSAAAPRQALMKTRQTNKFSEMNPFVYGKLIQCFASTKSVPIFAGTESGTWRL